MPFQSESQRRFMYSQHPKLAKEFEAATPDNANLPEHKKKMANGGTVEGEEKRTDSLANMEDSAEAFDKTMGDANVKHDSDSVKSYLASKFKDLMGGDKEPEKMAEGGTVSMSKKELIKEHEQLVENLEPAVEEKNKQESELKELKDYAKGGVPGVTFMENLPQKEVEKVVHLGNPPNPEPVKSTAQEQEKLNSIYRAMGMGKYAIGGAVPQAPVGPQLGMPNQADPTYWEQVKAALAKLSSPVGAAMNTTADIAGAVTPAIRAVAPEAISGINKLTGASLPIPTAPAKMPDLGAPTPLSTTVPIPTPTKPPMPIGESSKVGSSEPKELKNLFNQDTSKLTEGVEASDRQAIADQMATQQRSTGSIVAQALAGLGDALAAKGGKEQHALKDIFSMQKQDRDEALANFDKARQSRLEKLDLQTKMGNNTINKLAAEDSYGVDEGLNKMLGAPPGTSHKDLPLYMQAAAAKAAQQEKDTDLYMKAHKQAADEIESAVKNAGIFNVKPSPEQMKAQGAKLADQYYNRAKGNVLFQPSDGQKPVWIPAKNLEKAKAMDPNGQVVQ